MSLTAALAAVPFLYVRNWRYYQGAKVFSYIVGAFCPLLAYAYLTSPSFSLGDFLLAWLLFWTMYEIGYLHNDCLAIENETQPTRRAPPEIHEYLGTIIAVRCSLFLLGAAAAMYFTDLHMARLAGITALTCVTFFAHNTLTEYRHRFVTLVLLSVLHPAFVLYVLGLDIAPYVLMLLPYLALKYVDYLFSKGIATVNLRDDLDLRWALYTAWIGPVLLLAPYLGYVYAFIYVNYTKHFYWTRFRGTKLGGRIAKSVPMQDLFGHNS